MLSVALGIYLLMGSVNFSHGNVQLFTLVSFTISTAMALFQGVVVGLAIAMVGSTSR